MTYGIPKLEDIQQGNYLVVVMPIRNRCINFYVGRVIKRTKKLLYVVRMSRTNNERIINEVPRERIFGVCSTFEDAWYFKKFTYINIKLYSYIKKTSTPYAWNVFRFGSQKKIIIPSEVPLEYSSVFLDPIPRDNLPPFLVEREQIDIKIRSGNVVRTYPNPIERFRSLPAKRINTIIWIKTKLSKK